MGKYWYHMTPERNMGSIRLIGLRPTEGGGLLMSGEIPHNAIFLARTRSDALEHLLNYRDEAQKPLIRYWTLLRVRLSPETIILEDESECEYVTITIYPSNIRVMKHFDLLEILRSEGIPDRILLPEFGLE